MTFCSKCGTQHLEETFPKKCKSCGLESYQNPIPVVIAVIPVTGGGIVVQQRGISPGKGELALPGGFMELGETPQEAIAREVKEEMGMDVVASKLLGVESNGNKNMVLIFFETEPVETSSVPLGWSNSEVENVFIEKGDAKLAFPAHQKYFNLKQSQNT